MWGEGRLRLVGVHGKVGSDEPCVLAKTGDSLTVRAVPVPDEVIGGVCDDSLELYMYVIVFWSVVCLAYGTNIVVDTYTQRQAGAEILSICHRVTPWVTIFNLTKLHLVVD